MRARIPVTAIAVYSLTSLLAGCGGGQGGFPLSTPSSPSVPSAPTVTVTAPETATAGFAFNVEWTSSNATACSAQFTNSTATADSISVTATTVGNQEYSVTCTGAGGSATASTAVNVSTATAEGLWQGITTNSGRVLSGVVTKEGNYWLAYSTSANSPVVGFYAGHSIQTMTTAPSGTLISTDLREVNFDTNGYVAAGTISSPPATYSAKTSVSGTLNDLGGSTIFDWSMTGVISGAGPLTGILTGSESGSGTGVAILDNSGTLTLSSVSYSTTTNLGGTQNSIGDVVFTGTYAGGVFTPTGGTKTQISCTGTNCPANGTVVTLDTFVGSINQVSGGSFTLHFGQVGTADINETNTLVLSSMSGLPSINADTFTLNTYDPVYEAIPNLATIGGDYVGEAGIGASKSANTATLHIDAQSGAITGASPTGCQYAGTAVTHTSGGNVYDIKLTTFTGCPSGYDSEFDGVAVLSDGQITVLAMDSTNQKYGFLFIGSKP